MENVILYYLSILIPSSGRGGGETTARMK